MVVDNPYGTEARIKHMNTTCHVDRLRASSGRYPRDSRLESAWGLSIILSSAILLIVFLFSGGFGGVRGGFREVFFALSVRGRRADVLPLRE